MKIKYKNGEVSHVRNDLGRELVRAGIAEAVDDGAVDRGERLPKPGDFVMPAPKWSIGEDLADHVIIRFELLGQRMFYSGKPELISSRTFGGHTAPADILAAYKQEYRIPAKRDPEVAAHQEQILTGRGPGPNEENIHMARAGKDAEAKERERALKFVPENPDISIGRKLWETVTGK